MNSKYEKIISYNATQVRCLQIGAKSSRVLVTGGGDCRVLLWAIGKPSAILTLQGHSSSVESVALDWPEELVVAGSLQGSLKLWDLEQAKVIRTLNGHRSAIKALEFHPFGDFFASGSTDMQIKLWDVRRKGCIQTYHGHSDQINNLKITPDGRWIASTSNDKTIKIWDMTAGKLIHTIESDSPIRSISFSPSEFVMASQSVVGVKVHDLQTFECISEYKIDTDWPLLAFRSNGDELLTPTKNGLQILSWEPIKPLFEIQNINWSNLEDMRCLAESEKVVCASVNGNFVDIWYP